MFTDADVSAFASAGREYRTDRVCNIHIPAHHGNPARHMLRTSIATPVTRL